MDQEEFKKNLQQTSPDTLGSSLEKKKEAMSQDVDLKDARAVEYKASQKVRAEKKVGIKTYRDYAADELKKGGGTLTRMIVQERDKEREQKRHSVKNTKNIAISFLAGLFILAGIGIVILSFILVSQKQEKSQERNSFIVAPEPLIISDFRKEIYIKSPNRTKIIREVQNEIDDTNIPLGSIKHVYLVKDGDDVIKELVSSQSFFRGMDADVSSALSRTIDPVFMYGLYSSTDIAPFLLFTVSSYSVAYSNLLDWEKDMVRDLEDLFTQDLSGTSRSVFEDLVLFNTDVRVILDKQGEVLFGYGFLQDKKTLIFFDNRLTLREVITRVQRNTIKQ